MANCRFGFFPNKLDCSPLLLAEALVRKCPALVNADILGGWKYINNETGALFNVDNIGEKIDFMFKTNFQPLKFYMSQYGYKKTAIRLAKFGARHFRSFRRMKMVAMPGSRSLLRRYQ